MNVNLVCNFCLHPVLNREQPCPFCSSKNIAKKCPDCDAIMHKLPQDNVTSTIDVCHQCAFKAGIKHTH